MLFSELIEVFKQCSDNLMGVEAHCRAYPQIRIDLYKDTYPSSQTRQSAVLVLFYEMGGSIYFCLIKRPEYSGHHSSQISFPGGKFEKEDVVLTRTAIREAHEEIGVKTEDIELIGELSEVFIPVSDYIMKPYIGIYRNTPIFSPSKNEVEYIIHVDFKEFMSTALILSEVTTNKHPIPAPTYLIGREKVWGATAMVLTELKMILEKLQAQ